MNNKRKYTDDDDDELDDDLGLESSISNDEYKVYHRTLTQLHDVYLNDHVGNNSHDYVDLIHFLRTVKKDDLVRLTLSNFGGACHVGFRLAYAIQQCSAAVAIYATAPCYSMGSIISLSGDYLELQSGAFLMFHNYSTMDAGKAGELETSLVEYSRYYKQSLNNICRPFLSKKEVEDICADDDRYFNSSDPKINLDKRLKKHYPNYDIIKKRLESL